MAEISAVAHTIKADIGAIIRRNLDRDKTYQHEHSTARDARWNVAMVQMARVVDRNLIGAGAQGQEGE